MKNCSLFRLLRLTSFIGQFVHKVGGNGVKKLGGGIVILSSCEYYFFRVHENLVQHPCNNKSIYLGLVEEINHAGVQAPLPDDASVGPPQVHHQVLGVGGGGGEHQGVGLDQSEGVQATASCGWTRPIQVKPHYLMFVNYS